jgi:hypothetical protein
MQTCVGVAVPGEPRGLLSANFAEMAQNFTDKSHAEFRRR